jgi:hypothetical protein
VGWFLSKNGWGREQTDHPQDLNLLTSKTNMDCATWKLIQNCLKVSATPSTAMRLAHLMTGEKYSDKQMEHIFEQARGVVCGQGIIHADKAMASNLLEVLDDMPNHIYLALIHDPNTELIRVKKTRARSRKPPKGTKKGAQHLTLLTKVNGKKPSTKHVPCTVNVTDEDLVKSAMKLDDSDAMLLFVDWGSDEDLRYITMFPEVLSIDTTYGMNREKRPLLVFAGTDNNRKKITALRAFLPSECEWVFRYVFEIAIPSLIGEATVERIYQINTDGERQIYNPLTKCIVDKSSPWFDCIYVLCNYHMIDKLFSTKVKITDSNRMLVEYCKKWVKTWCFDLEKKEEYDYSYNEFRKFMDSDRAKTELGHAQERILDFYIQSSFLPKEQRMVRHVRNAVRAFDYCISCQADHKNRSLKAPGGTKPQQNIHRSAVAMVNKAEHRYQVKASVSGRAIVSTQLWSKSITAQSLPIIAEGLCRAQVTAKNSYFIKSMGQLYFYVVAKKVELSLIAIPGGRPQIARLRVVTFEVDGSVCCSCDFFERVGIVCRHILAIVPGLDESMVDVRWRSALGFYFGKPMYARVTSVIMQALEYSLEKVKAGIPSI